MRQVVIPRFGAPDVLEIREAPDPSPGDGDIRIRVRAAGINFADILARLGLYPDAPEAADGRRLRGRRQGRCGRPRPSSASRRATASSR